MHLTVSTTRATLVIGHVPYCVIRGNSSYYRTCISVCTQLMCIEADHKYGGSGSTFFSSILTIEELAKVDPSVSVLCDVQNTLVSELFLRWGSEELKDKYLPRLTRDTVSSLRFACTLPNSSCLFTHTPSSYC